VFGDDEECQRPAINNSPNPKSLVINIVILGTWWTLKIWFFFVDYLVVEAINTPRVLAFRKRICCLKWNFNGKS
jgi:hypothetical protein